MRLNTAKSMKLARRVKGQFGTWQAVRKAARVENGVYVIERGGTADEKATQETLQPAGA
ncbi:hypothetical protein [Sphingobium yanoikuyae]|uniref:hypothetical protein n=1 Tax=Sphingobium yanoikuyae TaxID=13690 RepID=UPI000A86FB72|nr:hypothetical protein [Sphingobium yanoikuyae]